MTSFKPTLALGIVLAAGVAASASPIIIDVPASAGRSLDAVVANNDPTDPSIFVQPPVKVYDSIGPGLVAGRLGSFGGITTPVTDDFTTILAAPDELTQVQFTGGVATANHVLFFDFFDAANNYAGGFGIRLGQAGNFVWTLNVVNAPVLLPTSGTMVITPDTGVNNPGGAPTVFRWFAENENALIGANVNTQPASTGTAATTIYEYSLTVPAPASAALLGAAGLLGVRRRR